MSERRGVSRIGLWVAGWRRLWRDGRTLAIAMDAHVETAGDLAVANATIAVLNAELRQCRTAIHYLYNVAAFNNARLAEAATALDQCSGCYLYGGPVDGDDEDDDE